MELGRDPAVNAFLTGFAASRPALRPLLETIFIDIGLPRGGVLSTQALQQVLARLGFAEGAVRTSLSRAVRSGNFVRGRTMDGMTAYAFSPSFRIRAGREVRRIYAASARHTHTHWISVALDAPSRAESDRLTDAGFTRVGTGFFFRARTDLTRDDVVPERAITTTGALALPPSVRATLNPAPLRATFSLLAEDLARLPKHLGDEPAVIMALLRIILMHRWREAVIAQVELPPDRAANDEPIERARIQVMRRYQDIADGSDAWLDMSLRIAGSRQASRIRDRFNPSA